MVNGTEKDVDSVQSHEAVELLLKPLPTVERQSIAQFFAHWFQDLLKHQLFDLLVVTNVAKVIDTKCLTKRTNYLQRYWETLVKVNQLCNLLWLIQLQFLEVSFDDVH